MKLKYSFEIIEIDDDNVAVPMSKDAEKISAIIKLNSTAVDIFTLLSTDTTEEEILSTLVKKYDSTPETEIASYVHDFLSELSENGLLE